MTTMKGSLLREAAAVTLGGEPMIPEDDFYSFNSTDSTTSTQPPTETPTDYFYNYTFDAENFHLTNSIKNDFTPKQEFILNWTGRVAAFISFLGGLYICYWTWKRRDHVYHRLMFGTFQSGLGVLTVALAVVNSSVILVIGLARFLTNPEFLVFSSKPQSQSQSQPCRSTSCCGAPG
jgi:hypothetical protein